MPKEKYQLTRAAAAIYEEQKVTAIFRPLAQATLDVISVSLDERVLDVACGTGIVARVLSERSRPAEPVTGIDLNEGMVEVARSLTQSDAEAFRWHVGNVADMPFADASFSLAICQQGLQYFPDEGAALREMRRVLMPRGRVALTTWADPSPFFVALAEALERNVSLAAAEQSLAPFAGARPKTLTALLERCGFRDVGARQLTIDRTITRAEESIPKEIMGNPVGAAVAARGPSVMSSIVSEVIAACSDYRNGADLIVPQEANLLTASV